jgi:hypothetical protein
MPQIKSHRYLVAIFAATVSLTQAILTAGPGVPAGNGQLDSPTAWFTAGKSDFGDTIEYLGQLAKDKKLILTASNGFFSRSMRAKGTAKRKDVANGLHTRETSKGGIIMPVDYEGLHVWTSPRQTVRWHVWVSKPGECTVLLNFKANQNNRDATIVATFAGQTRRIKTSDTVQRGLRFDVKTPGKHSLVLRPETPEGKEVGTLYHVDLYGPAIDGAKLLRARWRPGAVHGKYRCSKMSDTTMWVMVSKSIAPYTSYSPITTPFGYYGSSFDAEGRCSGSFAFSMWSSADLPTHLQAHLLALGSPKGEFSGFGHEGTGVKPRGWEPLPTRPKELIQCLRVERCPAHKTYYGYYLNPETKNWELYCVGREPNRPRPSNSKRAKKTRPLMPGSFVEVPGGPHRQRTGDMTRCVIRKGWCIDTEGNWQRIDQLSAGSRSHSNKVRGVTKDGWFVFKMGGMEHFTSPKRIITLPEKFVNEPLPDFLSPEKTKQLYKLPATFGAISAEGATTSATITMQLKDTGTNARAVVYYGKKDCLSFAPRKKHGTERKASILKEDSVWEESKELKAVKTGNNTVTLSGLARGTKYFYRVMVTNDQGKIWTFETHSFTTK